MLSFINYFFKNSRNSNDYQEIRIKRNLKACPKLNDISEEYRGFYILSIEINPIYLIIFLNLHYTTLILRFRFYIS